MSMPPRVFVLYADFPPASAEADIFDFRPAFKAYYRIVSVRKTTTIEKFAYVLLTG